MGNAKSSPSAVVRGVVVLICAFAFTAAAQRVGAPAGARAADQRSRIVFPADREGQGSSDEIYLMNADGTGERRVTPTSDSCGNSLAPRWSPTGHQIAFHCFTPPHNAGIFVINPDGTGLRRVTPSGLEAAFASWSPDGKRIAFGNPVSSQVYVVNVDGSGLKQLTTGTHPDWALGSPRI
jgi:dipeptidyl aminopeptidase/acylaminoacyl peptidase